jgi:hypothetical protein
MIVPNLRHNALVHLAGQPLFLALLWSRTNYMKEEVMKTACGIVCSTFLLMRLSASREYSKRRNWCLIRLLLEENKQMRQMVRNLLPRDVAGIPMSRSLMT